MSRALVSAAAGCGKTTDLARRYLSFLRDGVPPDGAIAITFTRKAAAELKERVSLALRSCLGGPLGDEARAALGSAWPAYAEVAPRDPAVVREALAGLPEAPIGTTDAFVQSLLTEFALDAALPLPDGRSVPLDLPITPGAGVERALTLAARRVLDPPGGGVDPEVAELVRYVPLDRLLAEVATRTDLDHLRVATSAEVLGTAARWLAEVLVAHDLPAAYEVPAGATEDQWASALAARTNGSGAWAVPEVAAWLAAGADPARAPFALCGWLQGLQVRSRARKALREALERESRSFGPATLSLWQIVEALRYPYDDPAQVALADRLRTARWELRQRVLCAGLEQAALAGELGYEELLEAAIALCERPSPRLARRFRALLVDEVQDADPRQLRLYEALAALPRMTCYFVGDGRQSIYLFRGAEPDGMRRLAEAATEPAAPLATNRRSAPRLVEAQRGLFAALAGPMTAHGWRPLADLTGLTHDPANARLALDPATHAPAEPVWIVVPDGERVPFGRAGDEDLDDRALATFLRRLRLARAEPGRVGDDAAVLAPTWSLAERACRRIREWEGRADAAFVESSPGSVGGRVADDLRLWLRALLDRGEDAAWVGVFKHPSVGLSDAALARLAAGVGAAGEVPAYWRRPGFWIEAEGLVAPHDDVDALAFARARGPLVEAAGRLGRTSTAAALDALFTALDWREVLAAGPGGADEVAELEVLLDWIREHDAEGRPADAILGLLDDDRADKPHVHLERPRGYVACTTIFQAKGLAWDHVCVLRPGRHSRLDAGRDRDVGWMLLDGDAVRLEGLRLDPRGGLLDFRDPLGRLAGRLHESRAMEEAARLAYVAITRARRSVTFSIVAQRGRQAGPTHLSDLMERAWVGPELAGVAVVRAGPAPPPGPPPTGWAEPTGAERVVRRAPQREWEERAPSSLGAHLDPEARARHAQSVVSKVRLANGLHLGGRALAPPGTDPRTGEPLPGAPLAHLRPYDWGNVAHGWFAAWRFAGDPDPAAIDRYLAAEWGAAEPGVAGWLLGVSRQLASVRGPLWGWVTDPEARLSFEHPLLGLGRVQQREVLLSGRADLLVERRRTTAVIDFKAGAAVPTSWDDLEVAASLRTYAFQLHAYADVLERLGHRVDTVALWFVRSGTSVRWSP